MSQISPDLIIQYSVNIFVKQLPYVRYCALCIRRYKRDKMYLWTLWASSEPGRAESNGRCKFKYYRCHDTAIQIQFTCPVIKQNAATLSSWASNSEQNR